MKKSIFENIILTMISIVILLTGVLVGSPIKYNCTIITIITLVTYITYLFVKLIIYKEKSIIRNKLEISIILLGISTCIPLIFKTYISLNDTVYNIFKYVTVIPIYFIVRDLCSSNKKYVGHIINVVIVSAIVILVLGIDKMSTDWSLQILRKLRVVDVIDNENRMLSTFGYANSFAVCMAFSLFLAIGKYIKTNKAIYGIATFLIMTGLMLSYSRATLILVLLGFILYVVTLDSKELKAKSVILFIIASIASIIYSKVFLELILAKKNTVVWLITILSCIVIYIIFKLIKKSYKYIDKVNKKMCRKIVAVLGCFFITGFGIALFIEEPINTFSNKENIKEIKYKILNIKPNETYELEFNIEANAKLDRDIYTILIEEENKYYDKIKETSIEFGNFNGNKTITIQASPETIELALYFKSKSEIIQNGLKINEVKLNGKHYPINYKYVPNSVITKIKSISLNSKSVWERTTFYKDALKVIKDNWLFGIGRWRMEIQTIRSTIIFILFI